MLRLLYQVILSCCCALTAFIKDRAEVLVGQSSQNWIHDLKCLVVSMTADLSRTLSLIFSFIGVLWKVQNEVLL